MPSPLTNPGSYNPRLRHMGMDEDANAYFECALGRGPIEERFLRKVE